MAKYFFKYLAISNQKYLLNGIKFAKTASTFGQILIKLPNASQN